MVFGFPAGEVLSSVTGKVFKIQDASCGWFVQTRNLSELTLYSYGFFIFNGFNSVTIYCFSIRCELVR